MAYVKITRDALIDDAYVAAKRRAEIKRMRINGENLPHHSDNEVKERLSEIATAIENEMLKNTALSSLRRS